MFFTCSDDPSNLYLSTDADPANKKLIAQETGWSDSRTYTTVGNHPARLTTQPTAPPSIGIASSGGKVVLTFTGILQSSSTVDGHYADVPDAGSPFEVPPARERGFSTARRGRRGWDSNVGAQQLTNGDKKSPN